uniref:Uncharacterized protein n=1 Tax=Kalanchoe fedtschenkoi TaxID=63787 RepID=A0A7N0R9X4_KALFE
MGGMCSGGMRKSEFRDREMGFSGKLGRRKAGELDKVVAVEENKEVIHAFPSHESGAMTKIQPRFDSGEMNYSISRELKPSTSTSTPARTGTSKAPQAQLTTLLGRAGTAGLEVLDALGSSMSNLNGSSGFVSGAASRGNKVSILAFEVANTIAKGANLTESLSKESIQFMKKEILCSKGVQLLVSTDMTYLLSLAADDKREELDVFSKEVVRFGDLCIDPQWHNLDRYFSKLDLDHTHKLPRKEAEATLQKLTNLAEQTSELYHELNALDRTAQDYRRKLEEMEVLHLPRKGESFALLESELKQQKKVVRSLKKKSLWSKTLEEIVEKLVDVVSFLQQEILEAFRGNDGALVKKVSAKNTPRLGAAGLALHYANVINQIDNIASRPASLPVNARDALYDGLPVTVKSALRSQLQTVDPEKELVLADVKAEMEKTLEWLVPIATNTTKAHQGFGWVGEWANTGNEFNKKTAASLCLVHLQTLHHADQQKTDLYILKLVTLLHHLITLVRHKDDSMKPHQMRNVHVKSPAPNPKISEAASSAESLGAHLSQEEKTLIADVCGRRPVPTISKSQEFTVMKKRGGTVWSLSRSTGSSPRRNFCKKINLADALDVMDGLEPTL